MARPVDSIRAQFATLCALQADTRDQLDSVRRQIEELHAHELTLVATYGHREQRIDSLLDERLACDVADRVVTA